MNLVVFTVNEPLLNNPCVFEFCETNQDKIKGIVECGGFFCFKRFLATVFLLGISGLWKVYRKSFSSKHESIQEYCRSNDIPYLKTSDVNCEEVLRFSRSINSDLIVSINTPQKFNGTILSQYHGINLHFADLPKYKGLFPVFWALKNGEERVGISVIHMSEKVDSGKILAKDFISCKEYDFDFVSILEACFKISSRILTRSLDYFIPSQKDNFVLPESATEAGCYCSLPSLKDIMEYKLSLRERRRRYNSA